jgi:hypothetical protein
VVRITSFRRERFLDRDAFFRRAAERRSVPVFLPADFLLRDAFFFLAMHRSLSLGPAIRGERSSADTNVVRCRVDSLAEGRRIDERRQLKNSDAHFTAPIVEDLNY